MNAYLFVGQQLTLDQKNAMSSQVYTLPEDYGYTVVPYRLEFSTQVEDCKSSRDLIGSLIIIEIMCSRHFFRVIRRPA